MKTYKLIKPIGDYPLVEYKQAKDKSYYNHHANGDATWIFSEIVENMPEYFVEVKYSVMTTRAPVTKSPTREQINKSTTAYFPFPDISKFVTG